MINEVNLSKVEKSTLESAGCVTVGLLQTVPGCAIEQKSNGNHYLDVGDNVHANVCSWLDVNCSESENKWFVPGTCEGHGHRYAKIIVCGKEWCPECGKLSSPAHNRRYVRWLSKIRQFQTMRYLVLTIPEKIRYKYRSRETLKQLGHEAQEMMIEQGFKRGLRRWHWFGDRSHKWNPHLNIMVEGSYLKKDKVVAIKTEWANILGVEVVDVNISYKRLPGDMAGSLHYITRATFLDYDWDIDMALELRNFRNMVVWGRDWKQESKWEPAKVERTNDQGEQLDVVSIEKLINHECPICHSRMVWKKAYPYKILELTEYIDVGAGYRYIIDRSKPVHLSDDIKSRLHTLRILNHLKMMGAVRLKDGE